MKKEFYTIDSFFLESDAQIAKAKLESEGIPAFIWEENLNYHTATSYSRIRLQVYKSQKDEALKIYEEIKSYARDENGSLIVCPNCKAAKSEKYYSRKGIFLKLFPFFESAKYRCMQCNFITRPDQS
ncbi:DUF2007 domain-containing protein [Flagellimonas olearia]|uniref:DUF2007 domain-containing protein n=1 Tax=Flagellimonas olearia TaxID=552546 RepID=A0A6I1DX45_9FLAO|nr:DUF2007 domain-containing protein [Allomuricauda olearia]KAB7528391.1 DUF2007 domain-containing protein [Allomuricauda olearia]